MEVGGGDTWIVGGGGRRGGGVVNKETKDDVIGGGVDEDNISVINGGRCTDEARLLRDGAAGEIRWRRRCR